MSKTIKIVNSDLRGAKVVALIPDERRAIEFEAKSEADPILARVDVYCTSHFDEVKKLIKVHQADLVIFDQVSGSSGPDLQVEFLSLNQKIHLIPVVSKPLGVPELKQIVSVGGIVDYADSSVLEEYESFQSIVLNYLRKNFVAGNLISEVFDHASALRRALIFDKDEMHDIKDESKRIINTLILEFDFSKKEITQVLAAEWLYLPSLSQKDYGYILGDDKYDLLPYLSETGSWCDPARQPSSSHGFLITLSNYLAHHNLGIELPLTPHDVLKQRPLFLKHKSVRGISPEMIDSLCSDKSMKGAS